jgi:hypothetical protein
MIRFARHHYSLHSGFAFSYRALSQSSSSSLPWWGNQDPEFEIPTSNYDSSGIIGDLYGDAPVNSPHKYQLSGVTGGMHSCTGEFPELESSVGRLYAIYSNGSVKCPSFVRLSSSVFATAAHGVPQILRRTGRDQQRLEMRIPFTFSKFAPVATRDSIDTTWPCVTRLEPSSQVTTNVSSPENVCPISGVTWATPSHPPDLGADLRFLQRDSGDSDGLGEQKHQYDCSGLRVSSDPLQVGEKVVLCAFIRPTISWLEGWQWLQRASLEEIRDVDLSLLELRKLKYKTQKQQAVLRDSITRFVCEPWSAALSKDCFDYIGEGRLPVTKIISHGHVLAVGKDGLVAVTNNSTVGSSGGAYVRLSDPTRLCMLHLGLPNDSPVKHGNYNLGISVHHAAFKDLYSKHCP